MDQGHARLGPRRVALLPRGDDRGRRGPALHRAADGDPGLRGRRQRRPAGARRRDGRGAGGRARRDAGGRARAGAGRRLPVAGAEVERRVHARSRRRAGTCASTAPPSRPARCCRPPTPRRRRSAAAQGYDYPHDRPGRRLAAGAAARRGGGDAVLRARREQEPEMAARLRRDPRARGRDRNGSFTEFLQVRWSHLEWCSCTAPTPSPTARASALRLPPRPTARRLHELLADSALEADDLEVRRALRCVPGRRVVVVRDASGTAARERLVGLRRRSTSARSADAARAARPSRRCSARRCARTSATWNLPGRIASGARARRGTGVDRARDRAGRSARSPSPRPTTSSRAVDDAARRPAAVGRSCGSPTARGTCAAPRRR